MQVKLPILVSGFLVATAGLLGYFLLNAPGEPTPDIIPVDADPKAGRVAVGATVERTLHFYNRTGCDLRIVDVNTSCDCTAVNAPLLRNVAPDDEFTVPIGLKGLPIEGGAFETESAAKLVIAYELRRGGAWSPRRVLEFPLSFTTYDFAKVTLLRGAFADRSDRLPAPVLQFQIQLATASHTIVPPLHAEWDLNLVRVRPDAFLLSAQPKTISARTINDLLELKFATVHRVNA